jgi:hypothetical protein
VSARPSLAGWLAGWAWFGQAGRWGGACCEWPGVGASRGSGVWRACTAARASIGRPAPAQQLPPRPPPSRSLTPCPAAQPCPPCEVQRGALLPGAPQLPQRLHLRPASRGHARRRGAPAARCARSARLIQLFLMRSSSAAASCALALIIVSLALAPTRAPPPPAGGSRASWEAAVCAGAVPPGGRQVPPRGARLRLGAAGDGGRLFGGAVPRGRGHLRRPLRPGLL